MQVNSFVNKYCQGEISLKKSIIKHHIASTKHVPGKERIAKKEKRERDIAKAFQKYMYNEESHPSAETLPESVWVYRVRVLSTFLKAGVPISKVDEFRGILKEKSYCRARRNPLSDLIPFILKDERS